MKPTGSSEKEISHLLPFFVNDTLTETERAKVQDALAASPELRREAEALGQMRNTWRHLPPEFAEDAPGEAGLQRLLTEISNAEDKRSDAPPFDVPEPANTNAPIMRRIAALAAAAAFGALVTGAWLQGPSEPAGLEMASGGSEVAADGPTLTVEFQPDAALGAISETLRGAGFAIVDGPSAIGLYRLVRLDGAELTASDAEALRARDDIFNLVDDPE